MSEGGFVLSSQTNEDDINKAAMGEDVELPEGWEDLYDEDPKAEDEDPDPEVDPEDDDDDDRDTLTATEKQELIAYRNWIAKGGQPSQAPATTTDPPTSLGKKAMENMGKKWSNLPAGSEDFFADFADEVARTVATPLVGEIRNLQAGQQKMANKEVLEEFDAALDAEMQDLSPTEREMMKSEIYLKGYQRYGNDFNEEKGVRMVQKKKAALLKERHEKDEDYVTTKTEKDKRPPPTRRGSAGKQSAREDVEKVFRTSKKKQHDYGGKDWKKMIAQKLQRAVS